MLQFLLADMAFFVQNASRMAVQLLVNQHRWPTPVNQGTIHHGCHYNTLQSEQLPSASKLPTAAHSTSDL